MYDLAKLNNKPKQDLGLLDWVKVYINHDQQGAGAGFVAIPELLLAFPESSGRHE